MSYRRKSTGGLCAAFVLVTAILISGEFSRAIAQINPFSTDEPVRASMKASQKQLSPGDTFEVVVNVRIGKGYHIYGNSDSNTPFIPTSLTLTLPKGIEAAGEGTTTPAPHHETNGAMTYTNSVIIHRPLKVRADAAVKKFTISGDLRYQACDEKECFPPETVDVEATVEVSQKK